MLRPILAGRDTQMPDYLLLLTTLGGLAMFGVSGFVIGPVMAAFFLAVWEMFAQEHAETTTIHGEPFGAERLDEANAARSRAERGGFAKAGRDPAMSYSGDAARSRRVGEEPSTRHSNKTPTN